MSNVAGAKKMVLLALLMVFIAAVIGNNSTLSWFTSKVKSQPVSFSAGSLELKVLDPSAGQKVDFAVSGDGDSHTQTAVVTIKNTGTLPFTVRMTLELATAAAAAIGNNMDLSVQRQAGDDWQPVYQGKLRRVLEEGLEVVGADQPLGAGETASYQLTLTPRGHSGQNPGSSVTGTLTFTAYRHVEATGTEGDSQ